MKMGSLYKALLIVTYTVGSTQAIAQNAPASSAGANVSGATSNYQLLLEIRGLQREVAELRDRIDQQEFQLERINQDSRSTVSNQSSSNLPKKVKQFEEGGAVVEEIDLSNVAVTGGNVGSSSQNQPADAPVDLGGTVPGIGGERNTPFFEREPSLEPSQQVPPTNVPAEGETGSVFGPISNNRQAVETSPSLPVDDTPVTEAPIERNDTGLLTEDRIFGSNPQVNAPVNTVPNTGTQLPTTSVPVQPQIDQSAPAISQQDAILENGDFGIKTTLGEEELYANGLSELKQQKYEEAVSVLSSQLSQFPKGSRAPDAYYWIGESLYIMERLESAKKSYMSILNLFPDNRRVPNAIYKVAVIEYEQGNTPAARDAINTLNTKYPDSSAATQAKTRFGGIL